MSNRYEREIEEILKKSDDGRPSGGDRIRAMNQQRPPTRIRPRRTVNLSTESMLVAGVAIAFVAGTAKWYAQTNSGIIGAIATIGAVASFAVIVVALIMAWIQRSRGPQASWRGAPLNTPNNGPRRTPFSSFLIRWNLVKLRMNYRSRAR